MRSSYREIRTTEQEIPPAQNDGFTAAYLLRLLRRGAGKGWNPDQVRITLCDTAALPDRYQGVHVFAGDRMGVTLRFPTKWLFTTIERDTLIKSTVSRPQLLQIPIDFMAAFRQTIRLQIQDPELNLDRVARLSGISRQSLQRQLRKHGTMFSAELAAIKKMHAEQLLATTVQPITEVAQALGFTNSTSFTRALKSWTGVSPREYRRNQQEN